MGSQRSKVNIRVQHQIAGGDSSVKIYKSLINGDRYVAQKMFKIQSEKDQLDIRTIFNRRRKTQLFDKKPLSVCLDEMFMESIQTEKESFLNVYTPYRNIIDPLDYVSTSKNRVINPLSLKMKADRIQQITKKLILLLMKASNWQLYTLSSFLFELHQENELEIHINKSSLAGMNFFFREDKAEEKNEEVRAMSEVMDSEPKPKQKKKKKKDKKTEKGGNTDKEKNKEQNFLQLEQLLKILETKIFQHRTYNRQDQVHISPMQPQKQFSAQEIFQKKFMASQEIKKSDSWLRQLSTLENKSWQYKLQQTFQPKIRTLASILFSLIQEQLFSLLDKDQDHISERNSLNQFQKLRAKIRGGFEELLKSQQILKPIQEMEQLSKVNYLDFFKKVLVEEQQMKWSQVVDLLCPRIAFSLEQSQYKDSFDDMFRKIMFQSLKMQELEKIKNLGLWQSSEFYLYIICLLQNQKMKGAENLLFCRNMDDIFMLAKDMDFQEKTAYYNNLMKIVSLALPFCSAQVKWKWMKQQLEQKLVSYHIILEDVKSDPKFNKLIEFVERIQKSFYIYGGINRGKQFRSQTKQSQILNGFFRALK